MKLSRASFLRLTAASLGVAMVPALAACGKSSSSADGAMRFGWWGADARAKVTQEVIDAYTKATPGVSIKGESTDWSGYWDKLATYTAGKNSPDVIQMDQRYLGEYSGRGALVDLTTQSAALNLADLDADSLKSSQVDGKQYAVPSGLNAMGILVNVKVFKDAGLELPTGLDWTWSDFRDLAKQVQAASPEGTFGAAASGYEEIWMIQKDGSFFSADGIQAKPETLQAALEFEKSLIDEKASPDASISAEQTSVSLDQGLFAQNKLGMQPSWSNQLVTYAATTGNEMIMVPLPKQDDGSGNSGMYYKNAMSWSISTQSKDPAAAAAFISYLINNEEAAKLFKTDRGVPANLKVRDAVKATFDGADLACLNYIDAIKDLVTDPIPLMPKGSATSEQVIARAFSDVSFGKQTPAAAAQGVIAQMTTDLKNAQ
ncbi:sugar ABC transporter substrate-binding protein [Micrococcales bacterium 31B]|nr:sugar ABC transporter substrate-binding protein [Micrococcales bacterium 31B]